MENFFNYISKPVHPDDVQVWLDMNNIIPEKVELYADFALKNPFYSLEMPIRCEQFESNLQLLLEQQEKSGVNTV